MSFIDQISQQIATVTGGDFVCTNQQSLGGGCINSAFKLEGKDNSYFVKHNSAHMLDMFIAESAGLDAMAETHTVRVPEPVCHGVADSQSYLVMEYIAFGGGNSIQQLGEQLAEMHRHTSERFGFHINNTIGSTHQDNTLHDDWVSFWQQRRLGYQLELARNNGCGSRLVNGGEKLLGLIPQFFTDYKPVPSLLHGDLWGGNYAFSSEGQAVIFDPATYYGDREADIAMTELFGGFGRGFYDAYNGMWQLDKGYSVRKTLYNLYHIINHFNLFGGGYLGQAESMTSRLLSELT